MSVAAIYPGKLLLALQGQGKCVLPGAIADLQDLLNSSGLKGMASASSKCRFRRSFDL